MPRLDLLSMKRFILKFFLAIMLMLPLSGVTAVKDRDAPEIFVQFLPKDGGPHTNIYMPTTLQRTDSLPPGNYRARARIALTTEKFTEVTRIRELEWRAPARSAESTAGWLEKAGAWFWMPGVRPAPLALPFGVARGDKDRGIDLVGFDELWLDFAETVSGESCPTSVTMNAAIAGDDVGGKANNIRRLWLQSRSSETLVPVQNIDLAMAAWRPRDNLYLAKRVLGLGFEEDWRYLQDGKNTVFQRRFHQDLRNVEAVDLLFAPGVVEERVNLRVRRKDHLNPDEIITWDVVPKQIEHTNDGTRVRLYLGNVVKARLASQKPDNHAYLAEVIVFIPGEAEETVAQRPLRALVFQSRETSSVGTSSDIIYLSQRKEQIASGHSRLAIDLRPLAEKGWRQIRLQHGVATFRPGDLAQSCGIRPISVHLVALGDGQRPVLAGDIRRFSQALGGPFLVPPKADNSIEWIEADSDLPFALLTASALEAGSENTALHLAEWGLTLHVKSASRVRIKEESGDTAKKASSGLALSGTGGEVDLSWSRPVKLNRESRLILRVPMGAEQIAEAHAEIELDGGEKVFAGLVANRAAKLGNPKLAGKTVRHLAIRLKMRDAPFRLKLGELLLFHPRWIPYSEIIRVPRPNLEFVPLHVENGNASEHLPFTVSDNRVYGLSLGGELPSAALSWSTPVHQPASVLVALRFDYRLSAPPDQPCWLTVTLRGERRSVTQNLCPEGAYGELIAPLARALGDFPPQEKVNSISWKAQLPAGHEQGTSFDFRASLATVHAPSMVNLAQGYPLPGNHRNPYRSAKLPKQVLEDLAQQGSAWMDFGVLSWQGGRFPLALTDNPYFRVIRVNLDGVWGLAVKQRDHRGDADKNDNSPWRERLALFGISLALAAWAWLRRDSLARLRRGGFRRIGNIWMSCIYAIRGAAAGIWRVMYRLRFWGNRLVGVLVLVPGFWLLGYLGTMPLDRGMMVFTLMLSAGTLWHELHWRHAAQKERSSTATWWFGSDDKISTFVILLTAATAAWTAWSLGRGERYGVLLLIAAGYYYLPWLGPAVRWLKTGNGAAWAWAFMVLVLYLMGLWYGAGTGKNYFFTIGGMAVVLAWRAGLMAIRQCLEARWPIVAEKIYGSAGGLYFAGAVVGLVAMTSLMAMKLEFLAEQVAIVVYYFLVVGTVLEILALRRQSRKEASEAGKTTAKDTAG